MDTYVTEQDQLEAIKKWWKENWKAIGFGLVIGVGGLAVWRAWDRQVTSRAENASSRFERLMSEIEAKKTSEAEATGKELVRVFAQSPYASFAALTLAKLAVEANDLPKAKEHLLWVLGHSAELQRVAGMRLARVYLAEGTAEKAWLLVDRMPGTEKSPSYHELKGDVLAWQGKVDEARTAYREALVLAGAPEAESSGVQAKLDDLGDQDTVPTPAR